MYRRSGSDTSDAVIHAPTRSCAGTIPARAPARKPACSLGACQRRGNANSGPWVRGVRNAAWRSVRYRPRPIGLLRRCCRACSSDQKNTDFRQKAWIMLGSFSLLKSTSGTKTSGSAASAVRDVSRSSMSICSGRAQCAHSVRKAIVSDSFLRCPCTKGIANASIAQGEYASSPVLKCAWCGVVSTVTG